MTYSIAELRSALEKRACSQPFSVDQILRELPHVCDDQRAIDMVVIEAYVRELECGNRVNPSEFVAMHSRVSSGLAQQLGTLADLHSRLGLWSTNTEEQIDYPSVGETIRGYALLREIGRGAFSRVFLAVDENVGHRRVAVKFTAYEGNELASLGQLVHPNLPRILTCDHDADRDLTIICMEYVGTRSLADLIDGLHGPESNSCAGMNTGSCGELVTTVVRIVRQVADGLVLAHEQGILHFDVKPANILLRDDDSAVLIDFNLSAPAALANRIGYRGTLAYAAPEVVESSVAGDLAATPMSAACDVYSLGVVLFEALTGCLPWPKDSVESVDQSDSAALVARRNLVRSSTVNPNIDRELDEIVATALAWSPQRRFATVRDFRDALSQYNGVQRLKPIVPTIVVVSCAIIVLGFVLFQHTAADKSNDAQARLSSPQLPLFLPADDVRPQDPAAILKDGRSKVRWSELPEHELRGILEFIDRMPPPANESIRAAAQGYVLMLLQEYGDAEKYFREAAAHGMSANVGVNTDLGYCCVQQRQFGRASRCLELALNVSAEHDVALFLRSIVELELSQYFRRAPDLTYFDQLLTIDTVEAREFVRAAVSYCEDSLSANSSDPAHSSEGNIYLQRAVTSRIGPTLDLDVRPDSPKRQGLLHSSDDPSPLAHVQEARAFGVNLTTNLTPAVESYLDTIDVRRQ